MTSFRMMSVVLITIAVSTIIIHNMKENSSVEFKVSLESTNNLGLTLHISLFNHGMLPLPIQSGVLPWRTQSFLQWVAIPFIYRTPYKIIYETAIKPLLLIDDPGYDIDILFPGETIEGYISLNDRFPILHKFFKKKDVLICWRYPLYRTSFDHPHWYQGHLVVPKLHSTFYKNAIWEDIFSKKCLTLLPA